MKRYEQFKFFVKFAKKHKFKSDFPLWKMHGEFFDEKGVSAPQKLSDFFKKMVSKNNDFRYKNMKNSQSPKMTSKSV